MLKRLLSPAPAIAPVDDAQVDALYAYQRRRIFYGIFVGYAAYYLVRKNFTLAIPYLEQYGYSKTQLGFALSALSIAYGLSKFLMGNVSDRSNAKRFLCLGLGLSALLNIVFGSFHFAISSITMMTILMFLNGWVQGMGWPACGKTMVHWFTAEERGTRMAVWNIAHNVGGGAIGILAIIGLTIFNNWQSLFYFPAIIALFILPFVYRWMQDTPQSVGLPSIEQYAARTDSPESQTKDEQPLNAKEIFFEHVFNNKYLWYIAIANIFVYFVRYGVIDWAPSYLTEVKHFSHNDSSFAYFLYEYAGIPGTLLCGWLTDKYCQGNRSPIGIIYMVGVMIALLVYWLVPAGHPWIDNLALIAIGFLIYGPVMLIGLQALDFVNKKAAGTAAGLTGLFGYLGGAVLANMLMGVVVDHFGWDGGFVLMLVACVLAIILLAMTTNAQDNR